MKKAITVSAVATAILAVGSLAMASSTTSETSGFTFSFNAVSLTQADWGTVSGKGYTALVVCPTGQRYVNAYVLSEAVSGAYNTPTDLTVYTHVNGNGDVDGVYLNTAVGQGGQSTGSVELICAS